MANNRKNFAFINIMGLLFAAPIYADDKEQCSPKHIANGQFEAIKDCLHETEKTLSDIKLSEGASATFYKTEEGKTVFIQGSRFLTYGPWHLVMDLRSLPVIDVNISYTFYGTEDGSVDFSISNPDIVEGTYTFHMKTNKLTSVSLSEPSSNSGWEIGLGIKQSLQDIKYWEVEVKSLLLLDTKNMK